MSHDPEAVIANVLRGPLPLHGSPEDHAGRVLDALAAAGFTVTKGRYVQVTTENKGALFYDRSGRWWLPHSNGKAPIMVRIEGSTDG